MFSRIDASPSRTTFTVAADASHLGVIRRHVAEMTGDVDSDIATRLALAVSELVTNVIQHTDHDDVTIDVSRGDGYWTLEVSGACAGVLDQPWPSRPDSPSGRGLMIVRTVMDFVELVERRDGTSIRCTTRG